MVKAYSKTLIQLNCWMAANSSIFKPGEGFLWASKAVQSITTKPVTINTRPRVTNHGGATKKSNRKVMQIQKLTGIGKREINQDFIHINKLESGASFFLIADGMGGYEKGDEAARIVSENIFAFLNDVQSVNEKNIEKAVQNANLAIKQFNIQNSIKSGATIGGVIVDKNISHIFWVGDVMVYQINKNKVLFQTKSHTLVNSLLGSDGIKEEKSLEKYKHIVTRSISGKSPETDISYHSIIFSEDDKFVICSDGVHNTISFEQLILNIDKGIDLRIFEDQLQREATDNFSVIIVDTNNDK